MTYYISVHIANPAGDLRINLPIELAPGQPNLPKIAAPVSPVVATANGTASTSNTTQGEQDQFGLPPSYCESRLLLRCFSLRVKQIKSSSKTTEETIEASRQEEGGKELR